MNIGKTLFAQLMDFLPWKTFHRIVDRHDGDRYVKSMTCADQFRVMAFAQLTYRESLRDIEVCLSAQAAKLYHMGFRQEIKRSTLADANEARDWRIHAEFAQRLIEQARTLYLRRQLRRRVGEHGVRAGLDDHRSVSVALSVGAVSHDQVGGQDAYAARSCAATSPASSTSPTASWTTSMCSTSWCWSPGRSTSWIAAIWTSPGCT